MSGTGSRRKPFRLKILSQADCLPDREGGDQSWARCSMNHAWLSTDFGPVTGLKS